VSTLNLKHIVSSTSRSMLSTRLRSLSSMLGSTDAGSTAPFLTNWGNRRA
jgi:hypothetical protein